MDPLSEVLSMLKLTTYVSGGFGVDAGVCLRFQQHHGIKCYAVMTGPCWVSVEGVPDPALLEAGDCILLSSGLPFCLATDLAGVPVAFSKEVATQGATKPTSPERAGTAFIVGGHFVLSDDHFGALLHALPPLIHVKRATHSKIMRWSLECLQEEFRTPQPGKSWMAQQLANIMLLQAIRMHLQVQSGLGNSWLSALADPQMRTAITLIHDNPGHPWTVQSLADSLGMSRTVFAQKFRKKVAMTPMEYVTRWRMITAANRLGRTQDPVALISSSLGYETDSAFGRVFKKVWGCTPGQHRRHSQSLGASAKSSGT
jgi:AraC-like DNA-binding protein